MTLTVGGIAALRWHDGRLEMIDQRALPFAHRSLQFESAAGVAEAIHNMTVRGAPAIGCAAAYGIALEALRLQNLAPGEFREGLETGFTVLADSRPTAVNLFWALKRMRNAWQSTAAAGPARTASALLAEAHAICADDIAANRSMGQYGAGLLQDGARVLTHCNAGALATAGHGTALGVIRSAVQAGKRIEVIANETRPFLQGARLTVWELAREGIPVSLIVDSAAGYLMSRKDIDAVLVGADRIAANGDVVNKIGTYTVAVLADRHKIPFYVAAPISTIDASVASGADIPIEKRDAAEITGYGNLRWAPQNTVAHNPVFDVTPAVLVTALITEAGVVHAPNEARIGELLARWSNRR